MERTSQGLQEHAGTQFKTWVNADQRAKDDLWNGSTRRLIERPQFVDGPQEPMDLGIAVRIT
ncbi:hypothetical protein N7490_006783 [Penicillium lividum]|nr:hypothetical protein N7490_006783 [Penicillium lividum]